MVSAEDKKKILDFTNFLMNNQKITNENFFIKEDFVINFLDENQDQLYQTFKTPKFFPNTEGAIVIQNIKAIIFALSIKKTKEEFYEKIINCFDYDKLAEVLAINMNIKKPELINEDFVKQIFNFYLKYQKSRLALYPFIKMLNNNSIFNYIENIFERKAHCYNEIVRVEKLKVDSIGYAELFKFLLFIKPSFYINMDINNYKNVNIEKVENQKIPFKNYLDELFISEYNYNDVVPKKIYETLLYSFLDDEVIPNNNSSSKFIKIFYERFLHYKYQKVDRGAESPDKSWFSIAIKNKDFYGYNKPILDELYMIAGNNMW